MGKKHLGRQEKYYHVICWGVPGAIIIGGAAGDIFGNSGAWYKLRLPLPFHLFSSSLAYSPPFLPLLSLLTPSFLLFRPLCPLPLPWYLLTIVGAG
jgi:hypothetical protein